MKVINQDRGQTPQLRTPADQAGISGSDPTDRGQTPPIVATSGNGKPLKLLAYAVVYAPAFLMKMKSFSCKSAGKSSSRITTSTESHVGPATFQETASPSRSV